MVYSFYRPHERVTTDCGDEQITKQSMKAECDIHNILRQYQKTGIITHVQQARASYQDLPDNQDYQQALHTIMEAENAFAGLPSAVRDHFGNDPERLLRALQDPTQKDYLTEVGIFQAPQPPQSGPDPVPVPDRTTPTG